ncbi:MAG: type II toxin-antitoxin system RelE/ParE family toxin [Defluviitaleaceae bacterium]|nr:type II toxin-antitoxin system RelE/ParE family toxin [Defluviitaleaceae bacterium]
MKREFVYLQNFDRAWKSLGLTDNELFKLENMILMQPNKGELIQGTGGLRKIRVGIDGRGKSSGIRVLYVDFEHYGRIYGLFAYRKNESENITDVQKQMFRQLINELLEELKRKKVK